MTKTPAMAYYSRKIITVSRRELYEEMDDAPLTTREYAFLSDIVEGLSRDELAKKYHVSKSRVSQWKRSIFERMHRYDLHQASLHEHK